MKSLLFNQSEMARQISEYDWSQTPLGPLDNWPPSLLSNAETLLANQFPCSLLWGPDFIVCAYNDAYRPLLGQKHPVLGSPFLTVWPEAADIIKPQLEAARQGKSCYLENFPFTLLRYGKNFDHAYFNYCFSPVRDENGAVCCVLNTALETTERVVTENNLRKYRDELFHRTEELENVNRALETEIEKRKKMEADLRLKSRKLLAEQERRKYLSRKLVELLEKERQDMARALHDEIGQILTKLNIDLDSMIEKTREKIPIKPAEIEKIQQSVMASMDYVSGMAAGLRPHILENVGLVPAITNMLNKLRGKTAIKIDFHADSGFETIDMDQETSLALYRIVQEAVTNTFRHARADRITVALNRNENVIVLTVEDDGIGFEYGRNEEENKGKERLGIIFMKERTVLAGGDFHIESREGRGTRVRAQIPVD